MREYQPWDDSWRDQVVYIMLPSQVDLPVEMSPDFSYPIFIGAFEKRIKGEEFWKAVAGAMVYVMGHEPYHPQIPLYIHWLNKYNSALVKELVYDGADQATRGNLDTSVWLFQASILLNPTVTEAHYNLGLAYYQLGLDLNEKGEKGKGESCYQQAVRYLHNTLELDPQFSLASYNLGFIYKHMGLQDQSQKYLEKGLLLELDKIAHQTPGKTGSPVQE